VTNWRLLLEYDGTDFEGWQLQPGARTVQGALEEAFARITGRRVVVYGAGRTDAGVHAAGQVANARAETRLEPPVLQRALNASLPRDVAVRALAAVPDAFDARRDARSKLYLYRVWNAATRSPLHERWSHPLPAPLELCAMRAAAEALLGTHDFASFRAAGGEGRTSVRTLSRLELSGERGGELRFEVEGNAFLRHMVRNLVGTLLEVGRGRRPADWPAEVLAARDRRLAGPTAPARGLTLVRVDY
jgi:tRNA pseudouridine38-40 synthase